MEDFSTVTNYEVKSRSEFDDHNTVETLYYDVDGVLLDFSLAFADYWNEGVKTGIWKGNEIDKNPNTWSFGYQYGIDDMTELNRALEIFHETHDHLQLVDPNIPRILNRLRKRYNIELVSSYPNENKRVQNLLHHKIPYNILSCNVHDKVDHIRKREDNGYKVVAIFEDGPHHLEKLLPYYGGKIWSPGHWNYLIPMKHHTGIRFYISSCEWMILNN